MAQHQDETTVRSISISALRCSEVLDQAAFQRAVVRERMRADRSGQCFSLVLFDVSRLHVGASAPKEMGRAIRDRLRLTDEIGWHAEHELGLLLPFSDRDAAKVVIEVVAKLMDLVAVEPDCIALHTYPPRPDAARNAGHEAKPPELLSTRRNEADGGGWPRATPESHAAPRAHAAPGSHAPPDRHHQDVDARAEKPRSTSDSAVAVAERSPQLAAPSPARVDAKPGAFYCEVEQLLTQRLPWWKRAGDIVGSSVLLVALSPVLAIGALLVKFSSPGPVLFRQQRAGLGGRPFGMLKFRSMFIDAEQRKRELMARNEQLGPIFKIRDDPRITPLGRLLRRSSIDELPQLWNVLVGDMTLVGPRPPTLDEIQKYEPWQRRRLEVVPGITCLWQILGRSTIPFINWVRLDLRYIERHSWQLDLKILAKTIPAVLSRRGAL